jgi:predicted dehydrogenase
MKQLRWGILGTAKIARKNWKAIRHSDNSIVTAVASRSVERSRQFIAECQREDAFESTPLAFGSYEELLASREVDSVYIPLPTGLRKEWVVRAAEAGKHILCEKPCGASVSDLREMIEACRKNHVQFMDGVMFMHNPRLNRIRAALNDETSVGRIKRITSQFSFFSAEEFLQRDIRADSALEPLGCLGDLGWYCARFALWTMNWQLPRQVIGRILDQRGSQNSPSPVPFDFSGELLFDEGVSAGFYCSFLAAHRNWAEVNGEKGYLRVPFFVLPVIGNEGEVEINGTVSGDSSANSSPQSVNMIHNFAQHALSGKLNNEWPEWAMKTQIVVNACLESARAGQTISLEARK